LAECISSNNNTVGGSPNAGLLPSTGFGAGPRESIDAYWFSAHSAYVACDYDAGNWNNTCHFSVTAWVWNGVEEVPLCTDAYEIPLCHKDEGCQLHQIPFPTSYVGLTSLNFSATVGEESRTFYVDDLSLEWYNNTCEAGLTRISSRKRRIL
jgi:hypothetical protein